MLRPFSVSKNLLAREHLKHFSQSEFIQHIGKPLEITNFRLSSLIPLLTRCAGPLPPGEGFGFAVIQTFLTFSEKGVMIGPSE